MTKYILHGGYAGHVNSQNDEYFKEVLKSTSGKVNVLLVYFAKELDRIPKNQAEDVFQFEHIKGNRQIKFDIAEEQKFQEQVEWADVIHLHGGDTLKLVNTLAKFSNLREIFKDKVVAGESAGAYALSTYFFSKTAGGVFKGTGLVPVKTICHYEGMNKEKLDGVDEGLELLLLPDYQFKVFNI